MTAITVWTEARVNYVKVHWGKPGHSASTIGAALGLTRNAVIAKAQRLKLPNLRPTAAERLKRSVAHKQRVRLENVPAGLVSPTEPHAKPVTFFQLNKSTCRFPLPNGQAVTEFFCGAHPMDGEPYCFKHCKIAYQPVRSPIRVPR